MNNEKELLISEARPGEDFTTGIFVRAKHPVTGDWDSVDIARLDKESLIYWLRSRGGDNKFAENVVCVLLGW